MKTQRQVVEFVIFILLFLGFVTWATKQTQEVMAMPASSAEQNQAAHDLAVVITIGLLLTVSCLIAGTVEMIRSRSND